MPKYEWPLADGVVERFWAKVERRSDDECWPWTAFCNWAGYGSIRNGPNMALAHRLSWVIANGEIPGSSHALHRCDNPPCVNPAHLYLGTNADNMRDKAERGRSHVPQPKKRGEGHPLAKLKQADVEIIRATPKDRGSGVRLAKHYGVSPATISIIRSGKVWRD